MSPTPTVTAVRCRVFGATDTSSPTVYANPLAGWTGQGDTHHESAFRFPQWLVVEVELSTGEIGLGNAGLAPLLTAAFIEQNLAPQIIGHPVAELESCWQRMYRSTVPIGRKGLGMAAISAVDLGLWDAWAQHLGVPVHDLLGGRTHDSIPVYASRLYGTDDLEALAAEAKSYLDQGFTAMKQRFVWGPADGTAGMYRNVELIRTVREAVGDEVDLMADAYMGWDLDYATRMARLLEPFNLRWLEEPLVPDDVRGYAELRRRAPMPIAGGEHEATLRGFHELIAAQAVDVIQFDTNRVGGLTQARKICAYAEAVGIPVIPHAGQLHNYHLVASQAACPMAEFFPPGPVDVGNELPHLLFEGEPVAENGRVVLPGTPGLGLRLAPRPPLEEITR
jgi:L-alanine-DL-glutamate epimerase-like enolase superfamily enzyme